MSHLVVPRGNRNGEGGLAVALAESCISHPQSPNGAVLDINSTIRNDACLFGESQSRILVSFAAKDRPVIEKKAEALGAPFSVIGKVGGDSLIVNINGKELKANDPLYIMTPNTLPNMKGIDYSKLKTNVTVVDRKKIPVLYLHKDTRQLKKSEITFTFTVAKPETQSLGGGSLLGKHYSKNTGISIIRKAREIDFGSFGYFNPLEEIAWNHRVLETICCIFGSQVVDTIYRLQEVRNP